MWFRLVIYGIKYQLQNFIGLESETSLEAAAVFTCLKF